MSRQVVIIGAGGHAAVVIDAMRSSGADEPFACIDEDESLDGRSLMGVSICHPGTFVKQGDGRAWGFVVGVGGGDDLSVRVRLFDRYAEQGHEPVSVVHGSAIVGERVSIGDGTLVGPGAIVNPMASIGRNAIINSGAIVEHDVTVGDHAHIGPGAMLAGGVRVGTAALVGMGATVRQGVTIGDGAIVGMGAVVTSDVADGATVVGCPARPR